VTDPATLATAEAFDLAQLAAGAREAVRVLDAGGSLKRVTGGWLARNGRRFGADTIATLRRHGLVESGTGRGPVLVLTELGKAVAGRIGTRGKG